jgi:hypothetical protein
MTLQTLREIVEEAASALYTYKHPNVSECQDRLDEIIGAAKLGGISHDNLAHIDISRGMVNIRTTYSVRSCPQEDVYEFPEHILDAEDPIKAAAIWGLETTLSREKEKLDEARSQLRLYEKRVIDTENALATAAAN